MQALEREAEAIIALAASASVEVFCPSCGVENAGNARFCRGCGKPAARNQLPAELEVMRLTANARRVSNRADARFDFLVSGSAHRVADNPICPQHQRSGLRLDPPRALRTPWRLLSDPGNAPLTSIAQPNQSPAIGNAFGTDESVVDAGESRLAPTAGFDRRRHYGADDSSTHACDCRSSQGHRLAGMRC